MQGARIGTSGWSYDSWGGEFYPRDLARESELHFYCRHFDTVELNNSFYQLPRPETVRAWVGQTPGDFIFSVKASRYITHMKKLKDPLEGIGRLLQAVAPFGERLGPILFQLPPRWRVNPARLADFLRALPPAHRYAFEFRDRSWFAKEVYDLLRDNNAALCIYDLEGVRSPLHCTADFVYVRYHGPLDTPYQGSYDGRTLAGLARLARRWLEEGREVFCYFDNDQKGCAPGDARRLRGSLCQQLQHSG